MKKRLFVILMISALLLSPTFAFADTPDETAGNDIAAEQAVIEQDAPEETVDAAVEEDALVTEEADIAEPGLSPAALEPEDYDPSQLTNYEWKNDETGRMWISKTTGRPVRGLFKGYIPSGEQTGTWAIFYADDNGIVVETEGLVTVIGDRLRYKYEVDPDTGTRGYVPTWVDPNTGEKTETHFLLKENSLSPGNYTLIEKFGIQSCSKGTYLLNDNGTVYTTKGIVKYGNDTYFIQGDYSVKTDAGVVTDVDNSMYYVQKGGKVKTTYGCVVDGGTVYFVQNGGKIQTTQGLVKDTTGRVYYVQNGGKVQTTAGWVSANGKKYYATPGGSIITTPGVNTINGTKYLVKDDWSVCFTKGIVKAGGIYYYVKNSNGTPASNKVVTVGKKKYHVKSNCQIWIGPHKWKKKYYYSTTKGYLQRKAAILHWNGHYYHSNNKGLITTGKEFKFKGKYYISSKNGKIKTGFFKWKGGYYIANKKGVIRTKQGKYVIDGYTYYITSKGKMPVNKQFKGKDGTYRSDSKGHLVSGIYTWKKKYYYADTDYRLHKKEEILRINKKYYYNKKGGGLASSTFFDYKGNHYYAGSDAAVLTKSFSYQGVVVHPTSTGIISDDEYYRIFPDRKPNSNNDDTNA